jgi:hypothetical protein
MYRVFILHADVQTILSADTSISRQVEGRLFSDHLINESVSVKPLNVIETSIMLCSVSYDSCESISNQPARSERPIDTNKKVKFTYRSFQLL